MDAHLSGDMQRALARIPERQRAALLLAELHDLTGLELASAENPDLILCDIIAATPIQPNFTASAPFSQARTWAAWDPYGTAPPQSPP